MTLSKTPPGEPGWYWIKDHDAYEIVQVGDLDGALIIVSSGRGEDEDIDRLPVLWSERIPEPR